MTKTEFAALTKGQRVFAASLYDGNASVNQYTFLGLTPGGKAKFEGRFGKHLDDADRFRRMYHVTKRAAAEYLMRRAQEAFDKAQKAHAEAVTILAATSTLE